MWFWVGLIWLYAILYFLPVIVAVTRQVADIGPVIVLNLIPLGWLGAMILACGPSRRRL
jgi:hypothetical protein